MGFGELRAFFDAALEAVKNGDPADGSPHSREEFVALADMLDAKLRGPGPRCPPPPPPPHPPKTPPKG